MANPLPRRRLLALAFAAGVLTLGGCDGGPPSGTTSGTVTLDGKPLDNGYVTFTPADGKSGPAGGEIGTDGRYTVTSAVGPMKVSIQSSKVVGKKKLYDTKDSPVQDVRQEVLLPRYNAKTELKYDVTNGRQEKDWRLEVK